MRDSSSVNQPDSEKLKAAYEAANEGDVNALAGLITRTPVWRGIERGFLWWRRAPS
jgi:hypothetical protein